MKWESLNLWKPKLPHYFSHLKQHWIFENATFRAIKLEIWNQKYKTWLFLCGILKKTIAIFEISNLEVANVKKKKKCKTEKIKFGTDQNTHHLGTFRLELGKNYCHIWNQRPRICLMTIFYAKMETSNCEMRKYKNEPKMPYLIIFWLEF